MFHELESILVVDDNADIRSLIVFLLELEGYQILQAPDGERAIELLQTCHVDLVLLDVMMPGIDGFEVLKKIRCGECADNTDTPVVMLTARTQSSDVNQAVSLGANAYIKKPFKADDLREKVEEILIQTAS